MRHPVLGGYHIHPVGRFKQGYIRHLVCGCMEYIMRHPVCRFVKDFMRRRDE